MPRANMAVAQSEENVDSHLTVGSRSAGLMEVLPVDVLLHIFSFLTEQEKLPVATVGKAFKAVLLDPTRPGAERLSLSQPSEARLNRTMYLGALRRLLASRYGRGLRRLRMGRSFTGDMVVEAMRMVRGLEELKMDADSRECSPLLGDISRLCPRLRMLSFAPFDGITRLADDIEFAAVERLRVGSGISQLTPAGWTRLAVMFPSLRMLCRADVYDARSLAALSANRYLVDTLRICGSGGIGDAHITELAVLCRTKRVRSLEVSAPFSPAGLTELLLALAADLDKLSIISDRLWPAFSLSELWARMTRLRRLRIFCPTKRSSPRELATCLRELPALHRLHLDGYKTHMVDFLSKLLPFLGSSLGPRAGARGSGPGARISRVRIDCGYKADRVSYIGNVAPSTWTLVTRDDAVPAFLAPTLHRSVDVECE